MFPARPCGDPVGHEEEFNRRIQYNFKRYVLVYTKGFSWIAPAILEEVYKMNGYRCHKVVRYGSLWYHLHIKFDNEQQAREAVAFFKNSTSDLTAILVDNMLRDWFSFENSFGSNTFSSLTIVSINCFSSRDFLSERLLNFLFKDFGQPRVMPCITALNMNCVLVLFSSMTEALGACVAFGQWYRRNKAISDTFYGIQIFPTHKEAFLIDNSGGFPEQAFGLDYLNTPQSTNLNEPIAIALNPINYLHI